MSVYVFEGRDSFQFVLLESARVSALRRVANVAPADFNYDGRLDVMILVALPTLANEPPRYQIMIYLQTDDSKFGLFC